MSTHQPVGITELVLRDGHQSLVATRMSIDDMLPIAADMDKIGYWSVESWGGATFDAAIRYLGEDPWDRIRELKKAMPNTRQQMLLRGQNLLGYKHYADDVVQAFVDRAATNGVDVFRVFDALNDTRNMATALQAVRHTGKHAQGTLSYTVSPVHDLDYWVTLACKIADIGVDSIAVKDMAGLLKPYVAYDLVKRIKEHTGLPVHMQSHSTTGMATVTLIKAIEAGIDNVDTSISAFSETYGHPPTESVVAMLQNQQRDTGLDVQKLEAIASYFRPVRKKYSAFEGMLRGVDSRVLVSQVPGGMLTNMENQLKEQKALDKIDAVLDEIPRVRKDLGFIPLVTPTSQIVGTQAVINVLSGERYKTVTKEVTALIKGEYGATPSAIDAQLQTQVLGNKQPIIHRFADDLPAELPQFTEQLQHWAQEKSVVLREDDELIDDVLIYAQFAQTGLYFLENRNNPEKFEKATYATATGSDGVYEVTVDGAVYAVTVQKGVVADIQSTTSDANSGAPAATQSDAPIKESTPLESPLAGTVLELCVKQGDKVQANSKVLVMEAMKMETDIKTTTAGTVLAVKCAVGDTVQSGQVLLLIG